MCIGTWSECGLILNSKTEARTRIGVRKGTTAAAAAAAAAAATAGIEG